VAASDLIPEVNPGAEIWDWRRWFLRGWAVMLGAEGDISFVANQLRRRAHFEGA